MMSVPDRWPEQDLVHAIVLPNLETDIADFDTKKIEFTEAQARNLNLRDLPILMNHDDALGTVGHTIAYTVRDANVNENARAEVVFALTDEDKVYGNVRDKLQYQRNALMNGAHRDVSLGHFYSVDYIGNVGMHAASIDAARTDDPYGDPGCVINKNAVEISTCSQGKRKGSNILEYVPSPKSLKKATATIIRRFCDRYKYTPPPPDATDASAEWPRYIDTLAEEVSARRRALLNKQVSGTYRASANTPADELLSQMPWIFVAADALSPDNERQPDALIAALSVPQPSESE